MKRFLKENIKFIIVILICIVGSGLSTYATEYLFNSSDVYYDNSASGIQAGNVQSAIDELYSCASDYSAYDSRLTALENANNTYPVGSIYISVSSTNPSTLFGGTWESFGQGRTLIGMGNNGTTNYTTVGATGGSETKTLSIDNLPEHSHTYDKSSTSTDITRIDFSNGYAAIEFRSGGNIYQKTKGTPSWTANWRGSISMSGYDISSSFTAASALGGYQDHIHTIQFINSNSGISGNGASFSTQDPYITVYMWKRTG